jgi:hypothetical protein
MGSAAASLAEGADDAGRRQFARMLLAMHDDAVTGWRWSLWARGRALMAALLMLPARHPALSLAANDPGRRVNRAVLASRQPSTVPLHDIQTADTCAKRSARVHEAADALVAVPPALPECRGPFAFRTPADLRHSALPRAHLFARGQISPLEWREFCTGAGFLDELIDVSEALLHGKPHVSGLERMWTPEMAPWAVAVAHVCGGFPQSENEYVMLARMPRPPPTPFRLLWRAVDVAPALARAMLAVPAECALAVDVDNRRGEPAPSGEASTLLHVQIMQLHKRLPDTCLFRQIVERSSDATLNDDDFGRSASESALPSLVLRFFCLLGERRSPPSLGRIIAAVEMVVALLERANVDLQTDIAHRAFLSHRLSNELAYPGHRDCWHPNCLRIEQLARAFDAAVARRSAFRLALVPALRAVLDPAIPGPARGLPVAQMITIVATYILRPEPAAPF